MHTKCRFSWTSLGGKCALSWFYYKFGIFQQKLCLERMPPGKNCIFADVICGKRKRNQRTKIARHVFLLHQLYEVESHMQKLSAFGWVTVKLLLWTPKVCLECSLFSHKRDHTPKWEEDSKPDSLNGSKSSLRKSQHEMRQIKRALALPCTIYCLRSRNYGRERP